jgi:hypothetical protein
MAPMLDTSYSPSSLRKRHQGPTAPRGARVLQPDDLQEVSIATASRERVQKASGRTPGAYFFSIPYFMLESGGTHTTRIKSIAPSTHVEPITSCVAVYDRGPHTRKRPPLLLARYPSSVKTSAALHRMCPDRGPVFTLGGRSVPECQLPAFKMN